MCRSSAGERRWTVSQIYSGSSLCRLGGVYWQHPENNWDQPGYAMPQGATHVSAYAWGETGGEAISFLAGINATDGFEIKTPPVVLTQEPQQVLIPLDGVEYTTVTGGFGWVAENVTAPITIYLDDIQWIAMEETSPEPEESDAMAGGESDGEAEDTAVEPESDAGNSEGEEGHLPGERPVGNMERASRSCWMRCMPPAGTWVRGPNPGISRMTRCVRTLDPETVLAFATGSP